MTVNWREFYVHYLRDFEGHPYGCVIMSPDGMFGYSLVNREKGDHFSYEMARRIAFGRLACIRNDPKILPHALVKILQIEKRKAFAWLDRKKLEDIQKIIIDKWPDDELHFAEIRKVLDRGT